MPYKSTTMTSKDEFEQKGLGHVGLAITFDKFQYLSEIQKLKIVLDFSKSMKFISSSQIQIKVWREVNLRTSRGENLSFKEDLLQQKAAGAKGGRNIVT